jgi:lipoate---protein ligase
MHTRWRLFKDIDNPVSTAEGLAIDDTLPRSVEKQNSPPILHLYTFVPSAIVGKYQDITAALKLDRCKERGIEYNRRSTGGGTVIMGSEILALGIGINADYPGLRNGISGLFEALSAVLIDGLKKLGVEAIFRPKNDIEVMGKKIAGLSAAAESGKSLLFHTSMLVNFDIPLMLDIMNSPLLKLQDKGYNCFSQRMTTVRMEAGREVLMEEVVDAVQKAVENNFNIGLEEDSPDRWERESIEHLKIKRYSDYKWIFSNKHPRSRMGIGKLKTTAGLLEVYLSLSGGSIENVIITGDFFSTDKDINRIESALKWTSARKERIEENLNRIWEKDMIYGLDVPALIEAILLAKENQVRL